MSDPKPTRPDPGETQYGSQVPPPPPLQDNPRLIQHYGPPNRRRRPQERRQRLEREIAVLECELGIACDEDPCAHWLKMEWV